jgi:hypothetical protein
MAQGHKNEPNLGLAFLQSENEAADWIRKNPLGKNAVTTPDDAPVEASFPGKLSAIELR